MEDAITIDSVGWVWGFSALGTLFLLGGYSVVAASPTKSLASESVEC